eukprot:c22955_g1_i1 orf=370-3330(-)
MAAFVQDNRTAGTEAGKGEALISKLNLDTVFSTLPELEELACERLKSASTNCEAANEATSKDGKLCEEEASAGDSPRRLCVDSQPELKPLASQCIGMASTPQIPSELQENLNLGACDVPLPPMVESVTNNMLKVSIHRALSSNGEQLRQDGSGHLENGESSHTEHYERSVSILPNNGEDAPMRNTDADDKPLCGTGDAVIGKTDGLSLQTNDCKIGVKRVEDGKPPSLIKGGSTLDSEKDDSGDDDDDYKDDGDSDDDDEDEEEAEGSDVDDDDEEEVDDSDEARDSDSSSSTSSLSFLSSDDDDDEVGVHRPILSGADNQKDLEMDVESECEEGELKESPSQKKNPGPKKEAGNESSEDEGGLKKPVRSKNEMKDLPYVPKVSVTLEPHHMTVPVGFVSSVVGVRLIVEGIEGRQPLTEGSILWLTDQRTPLGVVDELFGPVKKPFYVVRYNDAMEMPEGARAGAQVAYVRDFADFVLNNPDLYAKGYDQSGDHDEELSDSEVDFSDDEKEEEFNRSKSRVKRGNSETSMPDIDNRRHHEKRAQGKRFNKDNQNWRSRGENNARTFQSNNDKEFSGRPPRHQNPRFQHHRGEREPRFRSRAESVQSFNDRSEHRHGNQTLKHQVQSQQSLGPGQLKASPPARQAGSTSDWAAAKQQHAQPAKRNQPQNSTQESQSMQMNHADSSTQSSSQQAQPLLQINQPHSFMQPTLQQVQPRPLNQHHNLMPQTSHEVQMNQPHDFMQSTVPQQVQPWQMNQPHNSSQMLSPQLPGIQHSQMPMYNHAVVAGQVAQVAGSGYGMPIASKAPLQSGMDSAQGLLPMYQSPIYQQQGPSLNQLPSSSPHQFSGQASQVPPNMGMPIGNQVQAVHADGYPVGVQSAAFAAPVLGIPAGSASTPFNYPSQVVHNQNFSGFTPGCTPAFPNQGLQSTFGVPEQARSMQPPVRSPAGSWQHQQSPQDSSAGPRQQQQPYHQRPQFSDQRKGPYGGRRF